MLCNLAIKMITKLSPIPTYPTVSKVLVKNVTIKVKVFYVSLKSFLI